MLLLCSISLELCHVCSIPVSTLLAVCCCVLWISAGTLIYELPVTAISVQLLVISFPSSVCFPCSWNGTGPIKPVFVFSQISSVHTATGFGVFQDYGCLISKEVMFGKYCFCGNGGCCEEKHNNTIIKLGSKQSSAASSYCLLNPPDPVFLTPVFFGKKLRKMCKEQEENLTF